MTRREALEFIEKSNSEFFRYGDLGYLTSKEDTTADINNMQEDEWNDGQIFESEFSEEYGEDGDYYIEFDE